MSCKKEYLTIVAFLGITGKRRSFRVNIRVLRFLSTAATAFLCVIIVTSVLFVRRYLNVSRKLERLVFIRRQADEQRKEIDSLIKRIRTFEVQMAKLERFDKRLRAITTIGKSGSDYTSESERTSIKGVGGSNWYETYIDTGQSANISTSLVLSRLNSKIERLAGEANTRLVSLERLDEFFKDQKLLLTSTPTIWPTRGWVTSGFGYRRSPFTGLKEIHEGVDIATKIDSPIIAPADGIVIRTTTDSGYGKIIEIDHGYGIVTRYGHNSKHLVKVGDRVKRGQVIARVGNTGLSTGPHLHYEVLVNGVPVDPFKFLIEG